MKDLFKALLTDNIVVFIAIVFGLFFSYYLFTTIGVSLGPVMSVMIAVTPIWLPFVLFYLTFDKWVDFVHTKFALGMGRTTLRLKIPQEIFKSPEAMENVLAQVHNVQSSDNLWQSYIDGKHPLIMSLEIVSIGGDVRLYINCPTKKVKNAVETQLYAQYPGIEIVEEEIDYTSEIVPDHDKYDMFALHIKQRGDEEYPIKTYIDFGLDKLPKEEFKLDPMAAMLEHIGNIKPHERVWVQFLCKPHTKQNIKTGSLHEVKTWEGRVQAKIDEMMGRNKDKTGPAELENQPRLTPGERSVIEAMERNMSKYAYEVGIRWVYITKKGTFDGNFIAPMIRSFSAYDVIGRNQLGFSWRTDYDYNWFADWSGKKKLKLKKKEVMNFKKRSPLHGSAINPPMKFNIMSVEELATVFHIPSSTVMTPGLSRLPSTRKEAPPNLPIGDFAS